MKWKWQLRKYADEYDTDSETTFLNERIKILPQLQFLDPGGKFAPTFAWNSKVRLK